MMHLFLNALGASTSSGLTYVRNVAPLLSTRPGLYTTIAAGQQLQAELHGLPNISVLACAVPSSPARRFWMEQMDLPGLITKAGADLLLSAGNFALRRSPVPQILLSGNALYVSKDFYRDLWHRHAFALWVDTKIKGVLARQSVRWAECTVAPSRWFAEELQKWSGGRVVAVHHGFDPERFFCDQGPLPTEIRQKLDAAGSALKLLYVTHYNYYRNFETLVRALPLLRERLNGRDVRLFLTCRLHSGERPGGYRVEGAASLIKTLDISKEIVELGEVPYHLLHHVYRACDAYVTAAYAETFAHPLVEAMASGLPIVASDIPVHREVCGDAALYFARFAPEDLAEQIVRLAQCQNRSGELVAKASSRARNFSWQKHVDEILALAEGIVRNVPRESMAG